MTLSFQTRLLELKQRQHALDSPLEGMTRIQFLIGKNGGSMLQRHDKKGLQSSQISLIIKILEEYTHLIKHIFNVPSPLNCVTLYPPRKPHIGICTGEMVMGVIPKRP